MRLRPKPSATPGSLPDEPLVLVDRALSFASRRDRFTPDEARGLLRDLVAKVDDPLLQDALASTVHTRERFSTDAVVVDRSQVVDALLDMRLVLAG
jgi:hypothetical protein